MDFKEGDIVKLKTGDNQVEMTVEKAGAGMIFCTWTVDGQKKTAMHMTDALEKVNKE